MKSDPSTRENRRKDLSLEPLDTRWQNQLRQFRDMLHMRFPPPDQLRWINHSALAGFRVFSAGWYVEAHHHFWERRNLAEGIYIYCTAGKGFYRCGKRKWTIVPGELLYCPPMTHHSYGADPHTPWTIFWMHVSGPEIAVYSRLLGFTRDRPVIRAGIRPRAIATFRTLFHFMKPPLTDARMAAIAGCGRLLLSTLAMDKGEEAPTEAIGAGTQRVIDYMESHVEEPADVQEWVRLFGGSRSHFQRQFKHAAGHSPHEYFLRLKIRKACGFLYASSLRVAEIADRLGISDPFYFSRLFRRITGHSPRAYLKHVRHEEL